jgi:hypothetical protein
MGIENAAPRIDLSPNRPEESDDSGHETTEVTDDMIEDEINIVTDDMIEDEINIVTDDMIEDEINIVTDDMIEDEIFMVEVDDIVSEEAIGLLNEQTERVVAEKERLSADIEKIQAEINAERSRLDQAEKKLMSEMETAGLSQLVAATDMDDFIHAYTRGEVMLTEPQEMLVGIFGLDRTIESASFELNQLELKQNMLLAWEEKLKSLNKVTDDSIPEKDRATAMRRKIRVMGRDIKPVQAQKISGM